MSGSRSTDQLVTQLADALVPVRPVIALRSQGLAIATIWMVLAAVTAGWLGLHPVDAVARGGVSMTLLSSLGLIGVSGQLLGLACRLPGREGLARAGAVGVVAGVLVVIAVGFALLGAIAHGELLAESWGCFARSLWLGIPSALLALRFSARGAPCRSGISGVGLALGAASLGALLVHLSCPSPSALHWLIAHALLPLGAGAVIGLLVAWALVGLDRRGADPVPLSARAR